MNTTKTYHSFEEIMREFLPNATKRDRLDHNDPEQIWQVIESEHKGKYTNEAFLDDNEYEIPGM